MIKNINFLGKPSREKFNQFVPIGIFLLSLSISISIFMNWYNKKIAIKEK